MEQLLNLKFKGGDVTELVDLVKTLGKLFYLGYEPILRFDEEKQETTDEVVGYEMIVVSEITKKPYKIKFDQLDMDFSMLSARDEVQLINPVVRFYQDSGALTQGSTISISAEKVRKVDKKQINSVPKSETVKQKA